MSVGLIKKNSGRCPTNFDREDWRRTMHRKKAIAAALTAALVSLAAGVDAKEFKYSSWTPPPAPNNRFGTVPMFQAIEKETKGTKDELTFKNFMGAQLLNCPECLAEYGKFNAMSLGVYASAPYYLMCNFEFKSMDDLKGKKSTEGNPMFARWSAVLGMSRIQLGPADYLP